MLPASLFPPPDLQARSFVSELFECCGHPPAQGSSLCIRIPHEERRQLRGVVASAEARGGCPRRTAESQQSHEPRHGLVQALNRHVNRNVEADVTRPKTHRAQKKSRPLDEVNPAISVTHCRTTAACPWLSLLKLHSCRGFDQSMVGGGAAVERQKRRVAVSRADSFGSRPVGSGCEI